MASSSGKSGQRAELGEVRYLHGQRARKFLKSLTTQPFFAVVVDGDELVVHIKSLRGGDVARMMRTLADQIEE